MNCDGCGEHEAATIISNMANGDTLALCGACLVAWAASLVREVDPTLVATETAGADPVPDPPTAATAEGPGPGGTPPRGKRRRDTTTEPASAAQATAAN